MTPDYGWRCINCGASANGYTSPSDAALDREWHLYNTHHA